MRWADDQACPLEAVTRREVEAGRLAADDDFRQLSLAGATVLGKRPPS